MRAASAPTVLWCLLSAGCAAAATAAGESGAAPPGAPELVPAGFGTLRQEEITLVLGAGALQIRATPLEEWIIRLTAPDTYRRLSEIRAVHGVEVEARTGPAVLFLVTFTTDAPTAAYEADLLQLVGRGRRHRPLLARGIGAGWGAGRIGQREVQTAVFAFDASLDLTHDLVVEYGDARSTAWPRILRTLEVERERARARARVGR